MEACIAHKKKKSYGVEFDAIAVLTVNGIPMYGGVSKINLFDPNLIFVR